MRRLAKQVVIVIILVISILFVGKADKNVYAATLDGNTIKNYVEAKVGDSYPNGYCLKFVEECYQNLGAIRPYNCCASKSGNTYIKSSSASNIPVGATVYFGNCGGGPCKTCKSTYYGHVGIYVGDGYFVHATGGKVQKSTISSWGSKYRGWGYCGNFTLTSDTQSPEIGNVWIASVTGSGYTVMAQVSDNVGVTRASCATWTEDNGQDDLLWRAMSLNGNTVSVYIPFSEHGDGIHSYINHIYVWDAASNLSVKEVRYGRGLNIGDSFYAKIRNKASGNCVANLDGNVVSSKSATLPEQLWKFERQSDDTYKIISCIDGTVLDVEKGNSADRTNIIAYPSNNAINQRWYITENVGGYNLVAAFAKGSSLNCYGNDTSDGANIVLHQIYNADAASVYAIDKVNSLTAYQPQTTSLKAYQDEKWTTETTQYQEGDTLNLSVGCRNAAEFRFKLSYNGTCLLDGNVAYEEENNYYYRDLKIGTYDIEVQAKNYLGNAETLKKRITVTAKRQEATITYNGKGGTNIAGKQTGIKGTSVKLSSLVPKKSYTVSFNTDGAKTTPQAIKINAEFAGWYENSEFTGTAYKAGDTYSLKDNVTLYAKYKNAPLPELPIVEKTGYTFIGWYTEAGNRVYKGSGMNANVTLTAHWKKAELSYISIASLPQKLAYVEGENIDLSGLEIQAVYDNGEKKQIVNYQWKGNTDSAGTSKITVSYTESGITKTADFSIVVNKKIRTITYHMIDGTTSTQAGEDSSVVQLYSSNPQTSYLVLWKDGDGSESSHSEYLDVTFAGWYENENLTSRVYQAGESYKLIKDIDLYGSYKNPVIKELPKSEKEGYRLLGWYTQNGEKAYVGMEISQATCFTALWEKLEESESNTNTKVDEEQIEETETDSEEEELDGEEEEKIEEEVIYEVGDEIEYKNAVYTITKIGNGGSVEYIETLNPSQTKLIIPSSITVDGIIYHVTSIGTKAFYGNKKLKKITIGANVTSIGAKSFYGCQKLTEIQIPSKVSKIGRQAFYDCKNLKKITIKTKRLTSSKIGSKAFGKIYSKAVIKVPKSKYSSYKAILKKKGISARAVVKKY